MKYLEAYAKVHPNLLKHDSRYPTPEYLKSITFLGNVDTEGEMKKVTPGSEHIVKVLLDETDDRPIWLQAWGGMNTKLSVIFSFLFYSVTPPSITRQSASAKN